LVSDHDYRRYVRDVESEASMAAFNLWRAAERVAALDAPSEGEALTRTEALAALAGARAHLGHLTYPACAILQHGGVQRHFEFHDDKQLTLLVA